MLRTHFPEKPKSLVHVIHFTDRPFYPKVSTNESFNIVLLRNPDGNSNFFIAVSPPGMNYELKIDGAIVGYQLFVKPETILLMDCHNVEPFHESSKTLRQFKAAADPTIGIILEGLILRMMTMQQNGCHRGRLLALLKIFLIYIGRQSFDYTPETADYEMGVFQRFHYMLKETDRPQRVATWEYAVAMSLEIEALNKVLKKVSGMTASQLIQRFILYKAKEAIISTDLPMKEIASNLGFSDIGHFSKFFRKGSGMTFTDFRKVFSPGFI